MEAKTSQAVWQNKATAREPKEGLLQHNRTAKISSERRQTTFFPPKSPARPPPEFPWSASSSSSVSCCAPLFRPKPNLGPADLAGVAPFPDLQKKVLCFLSKHSELSKHRISPAGMICFLQTHITFLCTSINVEDIRGGSCNRLDMYLAVHIICKLL